MKEVRPYPGDAIWVAWQMGIGHNKKPPRSLFIAAIGSMALVLGMMVYWCCLAGYWQRHLFLNTYGSFPMCWMMRPFPLLDSDGTKVFVDFQKNELAIVFDPKSGSTFSLKQDVAGVATGMGDKWATIPEMRDSCVLVDSSGTRVVCKLGAGEAKAFFERLSKAQLTGRLRGEIRSVVPGM